MVRDRKVLYSLSQLALLYIFCRVVIAFVILYFASIQKATWQVGEHPGYLEYTNIWDARWYMQIACCGYPTVLPSNAIGGVAENQWAFMPLFPSLMKIVGSLFGIELALAGLIVNFIAGFICTVLFFHLIANYVRGGARKYIACLFLNLSPIGFMFNLGYAEPVYFALLLYLLVLLQQRKWLKIIPFALLSALARPAAPAFALTVLLILIGMFFSMRGRADLFPKKERISAALCLIFCSFFAVLWPIIAWIVTRDPFAYFKTEHVWRSGYLNTVSQQDAAKALLDHSLFSGWFLGFIFWFGPSLGAVLAILVILAFVFWIAQKKLFSSMPVRIFCASYIFYIILVFFVQSSVFRIFFPLFVGILPPFAKYLPQRFSIKTKGRHVEIHPHSSTPITLICGLIVSAGFFALGIWWFASVWYVEGQDWTPP